MKREQPIEVYLDRRAKLKVVRQRFSYKDLASRLGFSESTTKKWYIDTSRTPGDKAWKKIEVLLGEG